MSIKRSANFNPEEVNKLMELVKKYRTIVEIKKCDSVSRSKKFHAWKKITQEYNSACIVYREMQTLKTKYENIKKTSNKKFTKEKKQLYAMGNGISVPVEINDVDNLVHELLKERVTGLTSTSIIDSDNANLDKKPIEVDDETDNAPSKEDMDTSQDYNRAPQDIRIKIEADDYEVQDSSQMPTLTSEHFWANDSEAETRFDDEEVEDENEKYESMSLDELKRVALIAQIKSLKEQRAAARAKKELNRHKLMLLKRNDGKD